MKDVDTNWSSGHPVGVDAVGRKFSVGTVSQPTLQFILSREHRPDILKPVGGHIKHVLFV